MSKPECPRATSWHQKFTNGSMFWGRNRLPVRELLGFDIGESLEHAFGVAFLPSLVERGFQGVQLVLSDAHTGLKAAMGAVFPGARGPRCRIHGLRHLLAQ